LLLPRDHRSEVTVRARKALLETADRFGLPKTMADGDCDRIAHGNCNCIAWTCMRATKTERDPGGARAVADSCSQRGPSGAHRRARPRRALHNSPRSLVV